LNLRDELVPFESESGRVAFRNAGRSRRYGLELDWQARLPFNLRWTSALTVLHARFVDYVVGGDDFDGNDEPGIPPWQVYEEIAWSHSSGLLVALEAFFVGGYFVDDANTARSRGYETVNLRAGYTRDFHGFAIGPFVGLNNITDSLHDGTVRLNALGGRYYEPAPGFNVYGGIAVTGTL
jgi:iron complex outermembrane receptor protein